MGNAHKYNFNSLVYLSDTTEHLIIYCIDGNRTLKIPFREKRSPQIQPKFSEMTLTNNILKLIYEMDSNKKNRLKLN